MRSASPSRYKDCLRDKSFRRNRRATRRTSTFKSPRPNSARARARERVISYYYTVCAAIVAAHVYRWNQFARNRGAVVAINRIRFIQSTMSPKANPKVATTARKGISIVTKAPDTRGSDYYMEFPPMGTTTKPKMDRPRFLRQTRAFTGAPAGRDEKLWGSKCACAGVRLVIRQPKSH